jgi:hypothetical protein
MLALNLSTIHIADKNILFASYKAIEKYGEIFLVSDRIETEIVLQNIKSTIQLDPNYFLQIQNLLKVDVEKKSFYVCQMLLDKFYQKQNEIKEYVIANRYEIETIENRYEYHTVGMAKINLHIEDMCIAQKQFDNKYLNALFSNEKDFGLSDLFNSRYKMVTEDFANLDHVFSTKVLEEIAKHDVLICVQNQILFIQFVDSMQANQSEIIADIFCKMEFISKF